ncbi:MAG TPA: 5'-nucleotidase, lipoprotein e(P4) family [Niabella sp.]
MKRSWLFLFLSAAVACTTTKTAVKNTAQASIVVDGKLWSALFQQKAAEYAALCYQAYNTAHSSLDKITQTNPPKPWAIVTDIDETFLDNSPYAVHRALQGLDYENTTWHEWTAKGIAAPLPGSIDFFNYAASKNVAVFYITNRDEQERAGTLANLKKFNFPFADNEHLIMMKDISSKESRRQAIADKYTIALFLGDNLSDFSTLWDKKSTEERLQHVKEQAAEFGTRYVLLPNFTYGGWEDALYGNKHTLTPAQKDSAVKANLSSY